KGELRSQKLDVFHHYRFFTPRRNQDHIRRAIWRKKRFCFLGRGYRKETYAEWVKKLHKPLEGPVISLHRKNLQVSAFLFARICSHHDLRVSNQPHYL